MLGFEADVVRTYFELNGFLVRSAGSPPEAGKKKTGTVPTLAVFNPDAPANAVDSGFRLFTTDVVRIRAALVSIVGWESSPFSADFLRSDARLLSFIKSEVTSKRLESGFSPLVSLPEARMGDFLRLVVLPSLPRGEDKLRQSMELIREAGAEGVYTFRVMLENLLGRADPGRDFSKYHSMQALRILKSYGLAAEPQLELFDE